MASQEFGDDGFEVGSLDLGFAVDSATCAKAVPNEVNGLISPMGTVCGGQPVPGIYVSNEQ